MRRAPARPRGFTLLELLIALAVTALVVALLFSGYAMIGRAEDRNQQQIDRGENMLLVSGWLQRKLESLRPLAQVDESGVHTFFSGNAAGALWLAPLPELGAGGGLSVLRVGPERHADGSVDLVVQALPYNGARMTLDWAAAVSAPLMTDVRSLQWSYQDGASGQWRPEWPGTGDQYPVRVRIQLGDAQGDWPALVVALPGAR
ncbi:MAG: prepilin-type N-terminal cleavage/methylation domain-containing protein [Ottowia sp.]|nr:prepilin-type N-terminal cleavage/methylation domain-containing protein [Ottowia sp.]